MIRAARTHQVPRSIFLGRPMPGPGEPLFTDEDTAWALALQAEEDDTCPKCGLPIAVCADPAYEMAYKGEVTRICWPTWAVAQAQSARGGDRVNEAASVWTARHRDGFTPPTNPGQGAVIGG